RRLNVDISVNILFEYPVFVDFCQFCKKQSQSAQLPLTAAVNPPKYVPLTLIQTRLWFMQQMSSGLSVYHIPTAIRIEGDVNIEGLKNSFALLCQRHAILRTSFVEHQGTPLQIVAEEVGMPCDEVDQAEQRWIEAYVQQPFDLSAPGLFRYALQPQEGGGYLLVTVFHHIIFDGWSTGVFFKELFQAYTAFSHHQTPDLDALPIQFYDYALWQQSQFSQAQFAEDTAYWVSHLAGTPEYLALPTDFPRPDSMTFEGDKYTFELPRGLTKQLNELAKQENITLFSLLMSGFSILLNRYANQSQFCIGTVFAGRNALETEPLLGCFIHTLLLKQTHVAGQSLQDLLHTVQADVTAAFQHQQVPADTIVEALGVERSLSYSPLVQVGFALQTQIQQTLSVPDLSLSLIDLHTGTSKYDLTLNFFESEGVLQGDLEFSTALFKRSTAEEMMRQLTFLYQQIVSERNVIVEQLSLLDQQRLLNSLVVTDEHFASTHRLSPTQRDLFFEQQKNTQATHQSLGAMIVIEQFELPKWQSIVLDFFNSHPQMTAQIIASSEAAADPAYCVFRQPDSIEVADYMTVHSISELELAVNQLEGFVEKHVFVPYDLAQDQLLHIDVVSFNQTDVAVVFRLHHMIGDGVSGGLMLHNLLQQYHGVSAKPLTPYADYVEAIQFDSAHTQRYWQNVLASCEPLQWRKPKTGNQPVRETVLLDQLHWKLVWQFCLQHKVTPALYFKALYAYLIDLYCAPTGDFSFNEILNGRRPEDSNSVGCFYVQNPVKIEKAWLTPDQAFMTCLQAVKQQALDGKGHHDWSIFAQQKVVPASALHFYFNYYHYPDALDIGGHEYQITQFTPNPDPSQVHLIVNGGAKRPSITMYFHESSFDAPKILSRLIHVSKQILSGKTTLSELNPLFPAEQSQIETETPVYETASLCQRFSESVVAFPDNVAVRVNGKALTYAELNSQSDALAQRLVSLGVMPGDLVAICLGRSANVPLAILAVLKSGAAYVPVDPNSPEARLSYILADAQANIVVTTEKHQALLEDYAGQKVVLDQADTAKTPSDAVDLPLVESNSLAYVIYTSGSTGNPKGVPVSHAQVDRLFTSTASQFLFSERDVWTLFHSYAFDFSVWELWGALRYGGCCVIVPYEVSRSPQLFYDLVVDENVTVLNQTPSAFYQFAAIDEKQSHSLSLSHVIFGGEGLNVSQLTSWFERHGDDAPALVNMYGITETTVHVAYHRLRQHDLLQQQDCIGLPISDLSVVLLNQYGLPAPFDAPGEIAVMGAGVCTGYLNQPALTQQKFKTLANNQRGYQSGDLGYYREDGLLAYIGRIDQQIQLRGFRIELGEIQHHCAQFEGVQQCVVQVKSVNNDERIIAYVIADREIKHKSIRRWLKDYLPEYMLPSYVIQLAVFPMTLNGKVNVDALPLPKQKSVSPQFLTDTEKLMQQQWQQLLGSEEVRADDNFFELGGHSLIATQALSRVRDYWGVQIALSDFFNSPTIRALAAIVDSQKGTKQQQKLSIANDRKPYLASFAQQRLWFLQQMVPELTAYNVPIAFTCTLDVSLAQFAHLMTELVERQAALRTTLSLQGDEVVQCVHDKAFVPVICDDWQAKTSQQQQQAMHGLLNTAFNTVFDLEQGPLCYITVARTADSQFAVLLNGHHSVLDGWSIAVILTDLERLHTCLKHPETGIATQEYRYVDYAAWQQCEPQQATWQIELAYWQSQLNQVAVLQLPLDVTRPATRSYAGSMVQCALSADLVKGINALANTYHCTHFVVLLTAFQQCLSQLTQQVDFAIGVPVAGREHSELESLVGLFVNTLAVRVDSSAASTYGELIKRVASEWLQALNHQQVPFEAVVDHLQPERQLNQNPIFQVLCSYEVTSGQNTALHVQPIPLPISTAKFDLTLDISVNDDNIALTMGYSSDVFHEARVKQWLDALVQQLTVMVDNVNQTLVKVVPSDIPTQDNVVHVYESPESEVEKQLAAFWSHLIGVDRVGLQDDFFRLGGHSLQAVKVAHWVRETWQCAFQVAWLFEHPTLQACAKKISEQSHEPQVSELTRVARTDTLPLSQGQLRLWFLYQYAPEAVAYHMPVLLRAKQIDFFRLQAALGKLVERHEILRTTYPEVMGKATVSIAESVPIEVQVSDYRKISGEALQTNIKGLIETPFDLAHGPVFRVNLVQTV
ncbi:MAG: amino acid adenylation domain-containing protein, partial [Methylococcales bacterium]|nr:amino acid adenylation domain-containing protein [Methylococcales bacterium]